MMLRPLLLLVAGVAGAVATALAVRSAGVSVVDPGWRDALVWSAAVLTAVVGAGLAVVAHRWALLAADVGAVAAGVLLAGFGAAGLNGTRWGWAGLFGDSAFRTQMATRYADHVGLVDYGYRDLPAYYPPAVGWLQGRVAAVTGVAGWEAVKPVQLLAAAVVPVLGYLLWRQVVRPPVAAAVAGLTAALTMHPQKPDEWLVLVCLVPWWLVAVRDVRAPGVDRWPAWRLGVVLGLLLLTHTFYFLPLGLATLLALGWDAARRPRPGPLPWRRALAIGAVGVAVSSPYWAGVVVARLRHPSDALQMRYSRPDGHELLPLLPLPLPEDRLGVIELVGLAWLVAAAAVWWRRRGAARTEERDGAAVPDGVAGGLALALAGAALTLGVGAVAERFDVGLLTFKTQDLVTALLLTCGALGGAGALGALGSLPLRSWWRPAATAAALAAVGATTGQHVAETWVTGPAALVAQTTRYPDGTSPHGRPGEEPYHPTLFVDPTDPSVEEVRAAWRELRPDVPLDEAVLVTSRVDLLATTPVYGFVAFKSIYSHPNGRFEGRVALLEEVAACPSSSCAAGLLRENDFDAVDGLVLVRDGDRLVLPFTVDAFPDRTRRDQVAFPTTVLRGPEFSRRELGRVVVVALRPEG